METTRQIAKTAAKLIIVRVSSDKFLKKFGLDIVFNNIWLGTKFQSECKSSCYVTNLF